MVVQALVSSGTVAVFPQPVALGHFTEVVLVKELALVSLRTSEPDQDDEGETTKGKKEREGGSAFVELAFRFSSLRAASSKESKANERDLPSYTALSANACRRYSDVPCPEDDGVEVEEERS